MCNLSSSPDLLKSLQTNARKFALGWANLDRDMEKIVAALHAAIHPTMLDPTVI